MGFMNTVYSNTAAATPAKPYLPGRHSYANVTPRPGNPHSVNFYGTANDVGGSFVTATKDLITGTFKVTDASMDYKLPVRQNPNQHFHDAMNHQIDPNAGTSAQACTRMGPNNTACSNPNPIPIIAERLMNTTISTQNAGPQFDISSQMSFIYSS